MTRKRKIAAVIFSLLILLTIGGIYAYWTKYNELFRKYNSYIYAVSLHEFFNSPTDWRPGEDVAKMVSVKNSGEYPSAVRVKLTESWKNNETNEELPLQQNSENIAIIHFANPDKWVKIGDYYYYYKQLDPNTETELIIDKVTLNPNVSKIECNPIRDEVEHTYFGNCKDTSNYNKATYTLEVEMESVQIEGIQAKWGTTINQIRDVINAKHIHKLTINYIAENGREVFPQYVGNYEVDSVYSITSPTYPNHPILNSDYNIVTGTMGEEDTVIDVVYSGNYWILSIFLNSEPLGDLAHEVEPIIYQYFEGDSYLYEAPEFNGYTCGYPCTLSGVMPGYDLNKTILYDEN